MPQFPAQLGDCGDAWHIEPFAVTTFTYDIWISVTATTQAWILDITCEQPETYQYHNVHVNWYRIKHYFIEKILFWRFLWCHVPKLVLFNSDIFFLIKCKKLCVFHHVFPNISNSMQSANDSITIIGKKMDRDLYFAKLSLLFITFI